MKKSCKYIWSVLLSSTFLSANISADEQVQNISKQVYLLVDDILYEIPKWEKIPYSYTCREVLWKTVYISEAHHADKIITNAKDRVELSEITLKGVFNSPKCQEK